MSRRRRSRQISSITEMFVDPLFGAFGAFLFIFLMVIIIMGFRVVTYDPQIVTEKLTPAYNTVKYEVAFSAKEGMGAYDWSLVDQSSLPDGLSLTKDGVLKGHPLLPPEAGKKRTYKFEVKVDSRKRAPDTQPDTREFELELFRDIPSDIFIIPPVKIATDSNLPVVPDRSEYNLSLSSVGGVPPYTWSLKNGSLPLNLDLASTGIISGRAAPEACGKFDFSVCVQDARMSGSPGSSDVRDFVLEVVPVYPPPKPLKILSVTLPDGIKGQPYSAALSAEGGFPPYDWNVNGLPKGIELNMSNNMLCGSPSEEGFSNISLSVNDGQGNQAKLPSPLRIQIREGEIVKWWKVFAFLLLYLAYEFFTSLLSKSHESIRKILSKKWRIKLEILPDGAVRCGDAYGGIGCHLLSQAGNRIRCCTGKLGHFEALTSAFKTWTKFKWVNTLFEIGLLRIFFILQGVVLFFFISREEFKLWPELIGAILVIWILVSLAHAFATLKRNPGRQLTSLEELRKILQRGMK